ncbi:MAG: class I SAM-dependent methyltransferase [Actinomycetota bacterium]
MSEYALRLSEAELARYELMAEIAAEAEGHLWAAAGVVEGAAVADVGCGPGAVSALLARLVGATGSVRSVDRDAEVIEAARTVVGRAGVANVTFGVGEAHDTGIAPGSVDLVMIRHVLAHNGSREQAIVDHAASLVRPGGAVYLVDIDMTAFRLRPADSDVADLDSRYERWHAQQGNDLTIGLRLAELLAGAGLVDVEHHGRYHILPVRPGFRPPSWAARAALVAAGLATEADVARWDAAFVRLDQAALRPTLFVPQFFAFGRRPALD